LTDLPYAINNLDANVDANFNSDNGTSVHLADSKVRSKVATAPLDWSNPSTYVQPPGHLSVPGWEVILGADIVWLEDLVSPLVSALTALMTEDTVYYHAMQVRLVEYRLLR